MLVHRNAHRSQLVAHKKVNAAICFHRSHRAIGMPDERQWTSVRVVSGISQSHRRLGRDWPGLSDEVTQSVAVVGVTKGDYDSEVIYWKRYSAHLNIAVRWPVTSRVRRWESSVPQHKIQNG